MSEQELIEAWERVGQIIAESLHGCKAAEFRAWKTDGGKYMYEVTPEEVESGYAKLEAQHDELLAALEACVDELKRNGIKSESIQDARAAIAKAKGGQP